MLSRFDMRPPLCLMYPPDSKADLRYPFGGVGRGVSRCLSCPRAFPGAEYRYVPAWPENVPFRSISCLHRTKRSFYSFRPPIIGTDPNPIFNFSGWPKIRFTKATFARRRCGGRSCIQPWSGSRRLCGMPAFVLCSEWTIKSSVILDGDLFLGTKNHEFQSKVCSISEPGILKKTSIRCILDWSHVVFSPSCCN